MDIRSYLKEHTLLFDGGMSTYYAERNNTAGDACEWANLSNPQEVEAIHRAYLEAGCRALKTNTYGINRLRMPEADCKAPDRGTGRPGSGGGIPLCGGLLPGARHAELPHRDSQQ